MKLIVGLGNPGLRYKLSRHNIGFRVVDSIAQELRISFKSNIKHKIKIGQGRIDGERIALLKSLRFMNLCGLSVSLFILERKIELNNLLVICDCLDLPFGKIRLKSKGSDAGHRGMRSIITSLGREDFSRLKIGIGRPENQEIQITDYVLYRFEPAEEKKLPLVIKEAKSKIYDWINEDATYRTK
ncbi:MAG: aminoacyl-tRNA hydrolase [Candidatus Omnitrophota bacterium]